MLELPDVERMIEGFSGYATGKTISLVQIDDPGSVNLDPEAARQHIESHAIDAVDRHGKNIVLRFRSEYSLVFEMEDGGSIYLESQTVPPDDNSRMRLQFAAGRELRFDSPSNRHVVHLLANGDSSVLGGPRSLGMDPLSEDLTAEKFIEISAAHPRSSLKGLLMNPAAIAGIGNEYADEICFQAGYRPDLRVGQLADEDLARVHLYLRRVLKRATLHWQAAHADPGWLINHRVKDKPCPRCSTKLTTINLIGRKTFICVRCQQAA